MFKKLALIMIVGILLSFIILPINISADDLPDRTYSFENAPFPGEYEYLTEYAWEQFLQRAEELGHHTINVVEGMTYYYENGESESLFPDEPYYYSTDGTDVEEEYNLVSINYENMRYQWNYRLKFTDLERVNHINKYGHRKSPNDNDARIYSYGGSWSIDEDKGIVINGDIFTRTWYRADVVPPPVIESRPDIDMPYYVMYADRNYNTISLQVYENIPNFVFGEYEDMEYLEFDVNWFGRGRMTRYEFLGDDVWVIKEQTLEGQMWEDYGEDRKILMESNHNIIDFIDGTNLGEIEYTSGEKPKILGGSFDYDGYGVKFISPRNGFKDNSFIFNYQVWFRLPYDDIEGNIYKEDTVIIGFGGDFKEGTRSTDFKNISVKEIDGKKMVEGFYSISVGHEVGKNTVEVQVKRNNNEKYWSAKLQTERLAGFVDEDGDGLDDRTGRTDNNEEHPWYYDDYKQGGQAPIRDGYDDGILGQVSYYFDTLLFWLLSPFRIIADGISALIDMINSTFDSVNVFGQIISKLFSFLPSEIVAMLATLFISTIIIALIKVVRK